MKDLLVWVVKSVCYMVFWVYILSFSWGGQSLFDRVRKVLVENEVVEFVVHEVSNVVDDSVDMVKARVKQRLAGLKRPD